MPGPRVRGRSAIFKSENKKFSLPIWIEFFWIRPNVRIMMNRINRSDDFDPRQKSKSIDFAFFDAGPDDKTDDRRIKAKRFFEDRVQIRHIVNQFVSQFRLKFRQESISPEISPNSKKNFYAEFLLENFSEKFFGPENFSDKFFPLKDYRNLLPANLKRPNFAKINQKHMNIMHNHKKNEPI